MSLLIGFLGRKRSGKDTCAAALIREFGGSRVSFAHAIKEIAATHFGIPREDIEGDKTALTEFTWEGLPRFYPVDPFAEGSLTVRQFLQWFGTDIMRAIDPDVWIRPAMAAAQRALQVLVGFRNLLMNCVQTVEYKHRHLMILMMQETMYRKSMRRLMFMTQMHKYV